MGAHSDLRDLHESVVDAQSRILDEFLTTVIRDLKRDIGLGRLPSDWGSAEIQRWVSDRFDSQCGSMGGRRHVEFLHDCFERGI